jgi:hypothetical protein
MNTLSLKAENVIALCYGLGNVLAALAISVYVAA